jgi:tetratricopeptide (TPR) repeat protein
LCFGACSSVPGPITKERRETVPFVDPASVEDDALSSVVEPGLESHETDLVVDSSPAARPNFTPVPPLENGNRVLFDRATAMLREGNDAAAEVLFLELTESQPELAGPWTNLAHIYVGRGDQEEARRHLERALTANPNNCEALILMGVLARKNGLFSEAEEAYMQCTAAQPFFADAYLNLGILYELYMGRLGEALAAYNEYQSLIAEPDMKVAGWVMDLERRVPAVAER